MWKAEPMAADSAAGDILHTHDVHEGLEHSTLICASITSSVVESELRPLPKESSQVSCPVPVLGEHSEAGRFQC